MNAKPHLLLKILYGAAAVTALFTGFGNMPLWGRYYVADLPGLAWSGDFFINVNVHILAAKIDWRSQLFACQFRVCLQLGPGF